MARAEFISALEVYRAALETGQGLIGASLRIHAAKGGVPKGYWPMVGHIRREAQRKAVVQS